jgi:Carboxypeptidase regulatory-like domain
MNRATFPASLAVVALSALSSYAQTASPPASSKVLARDGGVAANVPNEGTTILGTVFAFDGRKLPPGANITLSSSGGDQRVFSLGDGQYKFSDVRPGTYELEARAVDLSTAKQTGIEVKKGDRLTRDVVLQRDDGPLARIADQEDDTQADKPSEKLAEHCWFPSLGGWLTGENDRRWGLGALVLLLIGMATTRWYKIAKPSHNFLLRHVEYLRIQVKTYVENVYPAVAATLNDHLNKCKEPTGSSLFLFWSQSAENATWMRVHGIEAELAAWLPASLVLTDLIIAEPQLRETKINKNAAQALADRIHAELERDTQGMHKEPEQDHVIDLRRKLLSQAKAMILGDRDQSFIALTDWQNKATWLTLVAWILMVVLGAIEGNVILFVAGAAGGLLSRMMRSIGKPEFAIDHGASWSTLFLSPLFGALNAWFGVGLITVLASSKVQALGPLFSLVRWDHPLLLSTLSAAFVLGFSERWFKSLMKAAEGGKNDKKSDTKNATPAEGASQASQPRPTPQSSPPPSPLPPPKRDDDTLSPGVRRLPGRGYLWLTADGAAHAFTRLVSTAPSTGGAQAYTTDWKVANESAILIANLTPGALPLVAIVNRSAKTVTFEVINGSPVSNPQPQPLAIQNNKWLAQRPDHGRLDVTIVDDAVTAVGMLAPSEMWKTKGISTPRMTYDFFLQTLTGDLPYTLLQVDGQSPSIFFGRIANGDYPFVVVNQATGKVIYQMRLLDKSVDGKTVSTMTLDDPTNPGTVLESPTITDHPDNTPPGFTFTLKDGITTFVIEYNGARSTISSVSLKGVNL